MKYHDRTYNDRLERLGMDEPHALTSQDAGEIVVETMGRDMDADIEETD